MTKRAEAVAPDSVRFWDTEDDVQALSGYCPDADCSPSAPCDVCLLSGQPDCDCCGADAKVVQRFTSGLPTLLLCVSCLCRGFAEDHPGTVALVGGVVARAAGKVAV